MTGTARSAVSRAHGLAAIGDHAGYFAQHERANALVVHLVRPARVGAEETVAPLRIDDEAHAFRHSLGVRPFAGYMTG
jgi:hypothetical protein